MPNEMYEYLLPVFVGHPFTAGYTSDLRNAVNSACESANALGIGATRRHLWTPEFAASLEETRLETVLDKVQDAIRHSALSLFDVSDAANPNVLFELGMAVGLGRPLVILARKPFTPPSDLRGLRGLEYSDMDDLERALIELLSNRLSELRRPPPPGQDVVFQKMQIDAMWTHCIQWASHDMYFFAGDVSWAASLREPLQAAIERGVRLRVCCPAPEKNETDKWRNIHLLAEVGAQLRTFEGNCDPQVRGFIADPHDLTYAEAMFVTKQRRVAMGGYLRLENTGVTIGESAYLYRADMLRGQSSPKMVTALVRLFEHMWQSAVTGPVPHPEMET